MKNKKLISTLIMLSSISSLILLAIPASAGEFHTVRGNVYNINNILVPEGVNVKIIFETGEETDLTSATGHYAIDFKGYDYETGVFWVYYNGIWQQPIGNPDIDISKNQRTYVQDLHLPNNPPNIPSKPSPGNGVNGIGLDDDLSWTGGDPDVGDTVTYDVYFGTINPPTTKVSTAQSGTSYNPGTMGYSTTYYWKIVASDTHGASTSSQVWSFTTTSGSTPPPPPPGPGGPSGDTNNPPTADAGGPYFGTPNSEIGFDGTGSNDTDGTVIQYDWKFFNTDTWRNNLGVTPTYTYTEPGTYQVTLRVTDDDGNTDEDTTTATISQPNNPPTQPTVTGNLTGHKNVNYTYAVVSTDPDGDNISYTFNWGDGWSSTMEYYSSGMPANNATHKWENAGTYTMWVQAKDYYNATSEKAYLTILIDTIKVGDIGYLVDQDGDGVYDEFQSIDGDLITNTTKQTNGTYLIDSDGDNDWDWIYDPTTDTLTPYTTNEGTPQETKADNTLWYALTIGTILAVILIVIIYLATRKKQKPKK